MDSVFPRNTVNLSKEDFLLVKEAIKSNKVIMGHDINNFQNLFSSYISTKYAIVVSSARAGLALTLKAFNLKPEDEVILPAYTFHVIPAIIKSMGFKPIFVDVRKDTYNINVSAIKEKITNRTRVILATHILGQPCEIEDIVYLSKKYDIKVIEDCAHSCGAEYNGKKVGSFGDVGIFSFGIGKLMTCFGGGAIACNNVNIRNDLLKSLEGYRKCSRKEIVKKILKCTIFFLLTHPKIFPYAGYFAMRTADFFNCDTLDRQPYEPVKLYDNFPESFYTKFTNLQAMVGIRQLSHLDEKINRIIRNAEIYNKELASIKDIITPFVAPKTKHVYLYYRIRVKQPKRLKNKLLKYGIDTKLDDIAVCPELNIFLESDTNYQAAREISKTSLDLPCYSGLREEDIYKIVSKLKKALP